MVWNPYWGQGGHFHCDHHDIYDDDDEDEDDNDYDGDLDDEFEKEPDGGDGVLMLMACKVCSGRYLSCVCVFFLSCIFVLDIYETQAGVQWLW